jgi:hypothetical protein
VLHGARCTHEWTRPLYEVCYSLIWLGRCPTWRPVRLPAHLLAKRRGGWLVCLLTGLSVHNRAPALSSALLGLRKSSRGQAQWELVCRFSGDRMRGTCARGYPKSQACGRLKVTRKCLRIAEPGTFDAEVEQRTRRWDTHQSSTGSGSLQPSAVQTHIKIRRTGIATPQPKRCRPCALVSYIGTTLRIRT